MFSEVYSCYYLLNMIVFQLQEVTVVIETIRMRKYTSTGAHTIFMMLHATEKEKANDAVALSLFSFFFFL